MVVATGAHERPVVFADNDRPGIMLAGAARTFLHRYGVMAGAPAVVFTTNDSAYAAAVDLRRRRRARSRRRRRPAATPRRGARRAPSRGIPVLRRGRSSPATERRRARRPRRSCAASSTRAPGRADRIECDLLLVSGGWNPAVHLFSQARGKLRYDDALGAFVPGEPLGQRRRSRARPRGVRPARLPARRPSRAGAAARRWPRRRAAGR